MKLSEKLRSWRADRPDEWKMDEFIRKAKKLETALEEIAETSLFTHEDAILIKEIAEDAIRNNN